MKILISPKEHLIIALLEFMNLKGQVACSNNGLNKNGNRNNVTLIGDNFGIGHDIKIYFGEKKRDIFVDFMGRVLRELISMPPEKIANLTIFVR